MILWLKVRADIHQGFNIYFPNRLHPVAVRTWSCCSWCEMSFEWEDEWMSEWNCHWRRFNLSSKVKMIATCLSCWRDVLFIVVCRVWRVVSQLTVYCGHDAGTWLVRSHVKWETRLPWCCRASSSLTRLLPRGANVCFLLNPSGAARSRRGDPARWPNRLRPPGRADQWKQHRLLTFLFICLRSSSPSPPLFCCLLKSQLHFVLMSKESRRRLFIIVWIFWPLKSAWWQTPLHHLRKTHWLYAIKLLSTKPCW